MTTIPLSPPSVTTPQRHNKQTHTHTLILRTLHQFTLRIPTLECRPTEETDPIRLLSQLKGFNPNGLVLATKHPHTHNERPPSGRPDKWSIAFSGYGIRMSIRTSKCLNYNSLTFTFNEICARIRSLRLIGLILFHCT